MERIVDSTAFGLGWERMDDELLRALRKGNKSFVRKVFSPATSEASVAAGQDVTLDIRDAGNVGNQAGRRSCRGGVTEGGNSALHIVATFGHSELAKVIWASDRCLLAARNAALETPLHCAARAGADRIVSLFISEAHRCEEAVLRATDREGKTALHAAVEGRRALGLYDAAWAVVGQIVSLFISKVCQGEVPVLCITDGKGKKALYAAAGEGHDKVVKSLLSKDPELAGIVDNNGVSPLYAAVLSKSLKVVQKLVEVLGDGGDTAETSYAGPNGQTALHAAAIIQSPEIAEEVLQWKRTIAEKADDSGSTPLHYLATTSNTTMIRQLLKYNTSVAYHLDFEGLSPIHVAARIGRLGIIQELIKSCPDIYGSVDNKGQNFLHIAVAHGRVLIVRFVCQNPCLVTMMNARDCDGNTPLHLAAKYKNKRIMCFLLINRSVHPSIVNKDGRTPLDLAITWLDNESILQNRFQQDTQNWIYGCLKEIGAISGPRRLDHLMDENLTKLDLEKEMKKYKDASKNLLVAAVLIVTVTFTAAFTMPGGYIQDDHQHDGLPTLARKYAFKAFIAADSVAFAYSVGATIMFIYAGSQADPSRWVQNIIRSQDLIATAAQLMVVAFAMSVFLLLSPLSKLIAFFCYTVPLTFTLRYFSAWARDSYLRGKVFQERLESRCKYIEYYLLAGYLNSFKGINILIFGYIFLLPLADVLGHHYCNMPKHSSSTMCSLFYG